MSIQIVQASPQSDTAETPRRRATVGSIRYPFDALEVGQAFTVPLATANLRSLRQLVRRHSQGDKRFVLVIHTEYNVVEIARKLPLPVAVSAPEPMPAWSITPASGVVGAVEQTTRTCTEAERLAIFGTPPPNVSAVVHPWDVAPPAQTDTAVTKAVERTVAASPAFGMPFGGGTVQPISWGNEPTDWSNEKDAK